LHLPDPADTRSNAFKFFWRPWRRNIALHLLPPYSPELNPQENIWDEIREKIFKNYALKSMSDVNAKLDEASLYIERSVQVSGRRQ
jgi:transposase